MKIYKSYMFRSKDPIIDVVRTAVQDSKMSYTEISSASGVSHGTLNNWFTGPTKRPQFCTVNAVMRAAGKELVPRDIKNGKSHGS